MSGAQVLSFIWYLYHNRGRNKEKLVDWSLILNHEVIFPRAARGLGVRCKPLNKVLTVMSIRN